MRHAVTGYSHISALTTTNKLWDYASCKLIPAQAWQGQTLLQYFSQPTSDIHLHVTCYVCLFMCFLSIFLQALLVAQGLDPARLDLMNLSYSAVNRLAGWVDRSSFVQLMFSEIVVLN